MEHIKGTQQPSDIAIELATLALKGKRFQEAMTEFTNLVTQTQSSEAWCGLGVSKMGLLLEHSTVDEIFYCFDKAKATEPQKAAQIEELVLQASLEVAMHLYDLYVNAVLRTRQANRQRTWALISSVAGTIFTLDKLNQNRAMGAIASAGLTALSYDSYLTATSSVAEMTALSERAASLVEDLKKHVQLFVLRETSKLQEFNTATLQLEHKVVEALKTADQRRNDKEVAQQQARQREREEYIRLNSRNIADTDHPFHSAKSEALQLYKKGRYNKSLPLANYALSVFKEDTELIEAKETMLKTLDKRDIRIAVVPWLILSVAVGVMLHLDQDHCLMAFALTGIAFGAIIYSRYERRKTTIVEPENKS